MTVETRLVAALQVLLKRMLRILLKRTMRVLLKRIAVKNAIPFQPLAFQQPIHWAFHQRSGRSS